jgi:predicted deacylase
VRVALSRAEDVAGHFGEVIPNNRIAKYIPRGCGALQFVIGANLRLVLSASKLAGNAAAGRSRPDGRVTGKVIGCKMTRQTKKHWERRVPEPNYAVELSPPDIEPYRSGNTGIDYVTTFDSGVAGPHVLVTALTHGNEICGAIALDRLFRAGLRPRQGKLTLAFDNVAAYRSFDPRVPTASRFVDEDFNRLWAPATLDGSRQSVELARARELRPIVDAADFLLDIHSMQYATAPLMLAGTLNRSVDLARRVGIPELIMCDAGHAAGPRMRDYGGFGDPSSTKTALLIESGQHWERRAAEVAIDVMLRFLIAVGTLTRDDARVLAGPDFDAHPRQRIIQVTEAVTITGDKFEFVQDFRGLEVLAQKGTLIGRDNGREVRTPYDDCVLIMPSRRLVKGQTAVRLGRYVT